MRILLHRAIVFFIVLQGGAPFERDSDDEPGGQVAGAVAEHVDEFAGRVAQVAHVRPRQLSDPEPEQTCRRGATHFH